MAIVHVIPVLYPSAMSSERAPSSTAWAVGKALCILSAVAYGLLTGLIDILDPHHLRNPDWPGHARFHLLWQISAGALGALASIYLFWTATPRTVERVRTGAFLGALHMGGFILAAVFTSAAGAEFDAGGRVLLGFLPPNMLHLGTSAALLFAGVSLCHKRGAAT
jgi:hypothetical protein